MSYSVSSLLSRLRSRCHRYELLQGTAGGASWSRGRPSACAWSAVLDGRRACTSASSSLLFTVVCDSFTRSRPRSLRSLRSSVRVVDSAMADRVTSWICVSALDGRSLFLACLHGDPRALAATPAVASHLSCLFLVIVGAARKPLPGRKLASSAATSVLPRRDPVRTPSVQLKSQGRIVLCV